MKTKMVVSTVLVFALALTLVMAFNAVPVVHAAYGPKTPNLLVHIYTNPDAEFEALRKCWIDIVDSPLTKYWFDKFKHNPKIQMRDYSEMAWTELTLNHQNWPLGNRWVDKSGPVGPLHLFDPTQQRDLDAKAMRQAIAYLNDKYRYIAEVLMGLGKRIECPMPWCFYGWYEPIFRPGFTVYDYNKALALQLLYDHYFRDFDDDGTLEYSPGHYDDGHDMEELPPLDFYIRNDDERLGAGNILALELASVGIPITPIRAGFFTCYLAVMIGRAGDGFHDFHLYTSGWLGTGPTVDHLRDQYAYPGIVEEPDEFAWNYGGFYVGNGIDEGGAGDDAYDYELWSSRVKYSAAYADTHAAVLKAEEIFSDFVGTVPWWSKVSIKAYKTRWEGFVNHMALGVDFACSNHNSFLNAYNPKDSTLDWGFRANPIKLNRITSEWMWEENCLGLIYDPLVRHDPFDYAGASQGWLAEALLPGPDGKYGTPADPSGYFDDVWAETGTWAPGKMWIKFKIRDDAYFHDGTKVTPEDVRFGLLFRRDCGPIAYEYPSVMDIDHVDIDNVQRTVTVYENVESYWAFYWIGYLGVMNKKIWEKAEWGTDGINSPLNTPGVDDWDYDFVNDVPGYYWDPTKVKEYHPWDEKRYNGVNYDLTLDGAGPWVFQNFISGTSVTFTAFTGYYKSQGEVEKYLGWSFHWWGNVNFKGSFFEASYASLDQEITEYDKSRVIRAYFTDSSYPYPDWWGIDYKHWMCEWKTVYNPDCDFTKDAVVDVWDLDKCLSNMGARGG